MQNRPQRAARVSGRPAELCHRMSRQLSYFGQPRSGAVVSIDVGGLRRCRHTDGCVGGGVPVRPGARRPRVSAAGGAWERGVEAVVDVRSHAIGVCCPQWGSDECETVCGILSLVQVIGAPGWRQLKHLVTQAPKTLDLAVELHAVMAFINRGKEARWGGYWFLECLSMFSVECSKCCTFALCRLRLCCIKMAALKWAKQGKKQIETEQTWVSFGLDHLRCARHG